MYYDRIKERKNVVLVSHEHNSFDLLDNCLCVATANGTIGWEALFKGKYVLAFGNFFYNYHENVYKIRNKEDCQKALNEVLNLKETEIGEKELKLLLKALEEFLIITGYGDSDVPQDEWSRYSDEVFSVYQAKKIGGFVKAIVAETGIII